MAQIEYFDKLVGITYVYDPKSYYDEESQKYKSKRKLIGKIDPDTGEIVPTGKRGRLPKRTAAETDLSEAVDYRSLYEKALQEIAQKEDWIAFFSQELEDAKKDARECERILRKIASSCAQKDDQRPA